MPITPLDLQTLFTQMAKPGAQQAQGREAVLHLQQQQAAKLEAQEQLHRHTVGQVADDEDHNLALKADTEHQGSPQSGGREPPEPKSGEEGSKKSQERWADPDLGQHIDVTG